MADQTKSTQQVHDSVMRRSYADSAVKRAYDLILAVGLLLLTAPVLLPTILLNMLFTGGHPIYVQRRAGKHGQEFDLFKLRTMRIRKAGETWSHRTDVKDGRLTIPGTLLRRTYLDELPQLINVIIGQMSMVGPRPETVATTKNITDANARFAERMLVKPGITGTAQIFFRKPESDHDLWRRYYYDHLYIVRNSFRFDLQLTVLTIGHVIRNKGT